MSKTIRFSMILVLLAICLNVVSCTECDETNESCVLVSVNDNSPPDKVSLNIGEEVDNELTRVIFVDQFSSPDYIPVIRPKENVILVTVQGEDRDGGIKSVELWVGRSKCRSVDEDTNECADIDTFRPAEQSVSNAAIGEHTLKSRIIITTIDLQEELGSYTDLRLEMWAKAENFQGETIMTPVVTIEYP